MYYNRDIELSNETFRIDKKFGGDWLCMGGLATTYSTSKLNSYYDKTRYRWYYEMYSRSYYRLDYKLYIFDMKVKIDCKQKFLAKLESDNRRVIV